jgi:hypothetical protein
VLDREDIPGGMTRDSQPTPGASIVVEDDAVIQELLDAG